MLCFDFRLFCKGKNEDNFYSQIRESVMFGLFLNMYLNWTLILFFLNKTAHLKRLPKSDTKFVSLVLEAQED